MIQAMIFDLDGTVLDNEGMWEEAFREVAKNFQLPISNFQGHGWVHEPGIGIAANWNKLVSAELVDKLTKQTWEEYWRRVGEVDNLPVREGVVDLVGAIKDRSWRTALATSSEWHLVERELEELDLYLAFDVTVTGEEVLAVKPDPEIYLLTAQKLGLDPEECVVIEDSVAGVRSAASAGMFGVGIISSYTPRDSLVKAGAKLVIDNLNQVMLGLERHGRKVE